MLMKRCTVIFAWTLFLSTTALVAGCGCGGDDDDNGDGNNGNGEYQPYAAQYVDGGLGPRLFVDRNGDGINDMCADVQVQASRAKPIVTFVVDGSSSMDRPFQGIFDTRWDVMVSTLDDVVSRLQSIVAFGMVLYSGPAGNCPDLRMVDPALDNYNAINQVISGYRPTAMPPRYTPTAQALQAAYDLQPSTAIPDRDLGQHFIILCTDGNPNSCEAAQSPVVGFGGDPPPEFDGPIQAVTDGTAQGIKTFIISLASDGQEYDQHLAQLAEIGNPGTPPFSPESRDALVAKMEEIVGGALGCQVTLNGKVTPGEECSGQVSLNGQVLGCNNSNGWRLVDEKTIELQGPLAIAL
jgi:hypothetical protein